MYLSDMKSITMQCNLYLLYIYIYIYIYITLKISILLLQLLPKQSSQPLSIEMSDNTIQK